MQIKCSKCGEVTEINIASEMAKIRHKKNPVDPKKMSEIGKKGMKKRWKKPRK